MDMNTNLRVPLSSPGGLQQNTVHHWPDVGHKSMDPISKHMHIHLHTTWGCHTCPSHVFTFGFCLVASAYRFPPKATQTFADFQLCFHTSQICLIDLVRFCHWWIMMFLFLCANKKAFKSLFEILFLRIDDKYVLISKIKKTFGIVPPTGEGC